MNRDTLLSQYACRHSDSVKWRGKPCASRSYSEQLLLPRNQQRCRARLVSRNRLECVAWRDKGRLEIEFLRGVIPSPSQFFRRAHRFWIRSPADATP